MNYTIPENKNKYSLHMNETYFTSYKNVSSSTKKINEEKYANPLDG